MNNNAEFWGDGGRIFSDLVVVVVADGQDSS